MDERRLELVLRAAECVPPGTVTSYGVIARVTGTSPRFVGRVLATHGSFVPWWRVTNVRGELPTPIMARAQERWDAEDIPHLDGRVLLRQCAASEAELQQAWEQAVQDLE